MGNPVVPIYKSEMDPIIYNNSTTSFTNLHLAGGMHQSGLLQREGKASLRIFQGRAYGGCG